MYALEPKTKYRHDVTRAHRRNQDLSLLMQATDFLIADGKLPQEYSPHHPLNGEYKGCTDAHMKPDPGAYLRN